HSCNMLFISGVLILKFIAVSIRCLVYFLKNLVTPHCNPKALRTTATSWNFEPVLHHPAINLAAIAAEQKLAAHDLIDCILSLSKAGIVKLNFKCPSVFVWKQRKDR